MAKCNDNRKAHLRRRRREERRLLHRDEERRRSSWSCGCGNWIEDGLHCELCCAEPPWGCPCYWCQGERYDVDEEDDYDFYGDDDYSEPVGSCEWCGTNLYEDEDEFLCDQCLWHAEQNSGGEDCGIQPVT